MRFVFSTNSNLSEIAEVHAFAGIHGDTSCVEIYVVDSEESFFFTENIGDVIRLVRPDLKVELSDMNTRLVAIDSFPACQGRETLLRIRFENAGDPRYSDFIVGRELFLDVLNLLFKKIEKA